MVITSDILIVVLTAIIVWGLGVIAGIYCYDRRSKLRKPFLFDQENDGIAIDVNQKPVAPLAKLQNLVDDSGDIELQQQHPRSKNVSKPNKGSGLDSLESGLFSCKAQFAGGSTSSTAMVTDMKVNSRTIHEAPRRNFAPQDLQDFREVAFVDPSKTGRCCGAGSATRMLKRTLAWNRRKSASVLKYDADINIAVDSVDLLLRSKRSKSSTGSSAFMNSFADPDDHGIHSYEVETKDAGTDADPYFSTRTKQSQTEDLDCLRSVRQAVKPSLRPSEKQVRREGLPRLPPLGGGDLFSGKGPAHELQRLSVSADTLSQKIKSRTQQITNLSDQLDITCRNLRKQEKVAVESKQVLGEIEEKLREGYTGDSPRKRAIQAIVGKVNEAERKLKFESHRALRWHTIAKEQRRYFKLTENETLVYHAKNHPAGELFLPPPPVILDDEEYGDLWDVGCGGGANPYVVDSWPLEPNVLYSKCNITSPPLGENIKEECPQDLIDSDDEIDHAQDDPDNEQDHLKHPKHSTLDASNKITPKIAITYDEHVDIHEDAISEEEEC